MEKMKNKLLLFFSKKHAMNWLLVIGLAGIALIGLSEWFPSKKHAAQDAFPVAVTAQTVERALEDRLTALLSETEGVGECRVMVTLEQTARFVYATGDTAEGGTITVKTDSGPVGLLLTEIQPKIRGVAVVCRGGSDPAVSEKVAGILAAVLDLSTRRISIGSLQ